MLRNFVRKRPFLSFYILAWIFASLANLLLFTYGKDVMQLYFKMEYPFGLNHFNIIVPFFWATMAPFAVFGILFPSAPSVSAIIISGIDKGKAAIKHLLSRYRPWREGIKASEALKWYAVIVGSIIAVVVCELLWLKGSNPDAFQKSLEALRLGTPHLAILFFVMSSFMDVGGFWEELGWRGYALPYLLDKMRSPLTVSVVLGILWGIWHLPREIPWLIKGAPLGPFFVGQVWFLIHTVSMSIIITFFFHKTGGSIIPAIMIHGLSNYFGRALFDSVAITPITHHDMTLSVYEIVMIGVAILLIVVTGPNLGKQKGNMGHSDMQKM
jgi:hypothetical protein